MEPYQRAFYTSDSIEEVLQFYESETGSMEETRKKQAYQNLFQPVRILQKGTMQPSRLGVIIATKRPVEEETARKPAHILAGMKHNPYQGHEYFRPLEFLVAQLPDKEMDDYHDACRRFGFLTWSFFMETEELDERGRPMNKAQYLIHHYQEDEGGVASMGSLFARIAQLMEQGRTEEAMQLTEKLSGSLMEPDTAQWDDYLELLEEITEHAFQTVIHIHRKPPAQ